MTLLSLQAFGEATFHELHGILHRVMGWDDSHLHEFVVGDRTYGGWNYEAGSAPKKRPSGSLAAVARGPAGGMQLAAIAQLTYNVNVKQAKFQPR